ncbi:MULTISPECIES: helix-turn-helix transcriptional regulator [unclassified Paenibacillus]|uniref:helix-turn-helix domain-containing protein n=1 Tax=unclassified Paenibacillus TaxID=185978 RepID=UPI001AE626C4|nr:MULTISPECIES: helix-turn-helix transcriptional regulator [unclassified Paenibacillus]MBP1154384.1 transcriptional regulator with XRE-family HTH domain [Paenibacillus sp. PvP091]MBP1170232.1 transcriptional regulator with XRE-family HTH domain [Paenibacillus sp. PvR098]MBP2441260.1 transcriptional regulator with XRE-family HTH domain [Paenibacillus sp. PvP052]
MKYGERIASLREKHAMTQEELSNKLGITRASLSHYENNRRAPDYDTITKIAGFFRVSIDFLLGRTDDPYIVLDEEVREFVDSLELSDNNILDKFALTIDGKKLTAEEAKRFIAFVRAERSINN